MLLSCVNMKLTKKKKNLHWIAFSHPSNGAKKAYWKRKPRLRHVWRRSEHGNALRSSQPGIVKGAAYKPTLAASACGPKNRVKPQPTQQTQRNCASSRDGVVGDPGSSSRDVRALFLPACIHSCREGCPVGQELYVVAHEMSASKLPDKTSTRINAGARSRT